MRACVLSDVSEFSINERKQPDIGTDEVLVRIERVGICGSDIHYYQNGENSGNVVDFPHILGHEASGTVVEVGTEVENVTEEDRVAIEPGRPCGECKYCTSGDQYHLCENMKYMSSPPVDGALVQYVAWPAELVYTLPDEVSLREGALVEPLSVAMHACQRGNVDDGDSVLVTGGGPIGQLVAEVALARGATDVVLTDIVPEKLSLATERGVHHTVNIAETDAIDVIHDQIDKRGVDIVIESSGANAAIKTAPAAVRRGGTVVFVGIPLEDTFPADVVETISQEYEFKGSYRFSNTYPDAIQGIRDGLYDVDGIVSFEEPFHETQAAFERAGTSEAVKGVIRVSEEAVDDR